jgi:hypothetical protein
LILIITTEKHRYTHASLRSESDVDARVISYDEIKKHAATLPEATYVFTDVDRLPPAEVLEAARYYRALRDHGQKVLNDPARLLTRFGLLRALSRAGINQFDGYRVEDLDEPRRWPVFLRMEGSHGTPLSGLLDNRVELDAAVESSVEKGVPRSSLIVIEYAAEPVQPGLFRKLSVFRVGERLLGYTCVHDDQWIVKYGKPGIAPPELYEEEYEFVANNPFADVLRPVFDIAGIDYGRVDFGLVDGRPQIYEINSNPHLELRPAPGPVARRDESNDLFRTNYLAALQAIDTLGKAAVSEEAEQKAV